MLTFPALSERVAFGSDWQGLRRLPIGIDVYIYASRPGHPLFRPGVASWRGILGAITPAVQLGRRSGKYPDPAIRPPSAEADDDPFMAFWEVLGLRRLEPADQVPLSQFTKEGG